MELINGLLRDYVKLEYIVPIFITMTICEILFLLNGFYGDGIIFPLAKVYAAIRRSTTSTRHTSCSATLRTSCDILEAYCHNAQRMAQLPNSDKPDVPAAADKSRKAPSVRTSSWHIASSAAYHMTGDMTQMTDYIPMSAGLLVNIPNVAPMRVHGSGSVRTTTMSLHNVMHVPELEKSLVSTSQLAKAGYTVALGPDRCRITKDQTLVGEAHFTDDYLFEVDFLSVPCSSTD